MMLGSGTRQGRPPGADNLVDLQIMATGAEIDLLLTKRICERLFAYRQNRSWPPELVKRDGWDEVYAIFPKPYKRGALREKSRPNAT